MPSFRNTVDEQWVNAQLAAIGTHGAVAYQPEINIARRRFILYTVFTTGIFGLGGILLSLQAGDRAMTAVAAAIAIGFAVLWYVNYRIESPLPRLTVSQTGMVYERLKNETWVRKWAYRWCDIREMGDKKVFLPGGSPARQVDLGMRFKLHDGTLVPVPEIVFVGKHMSARRLLPILHETYAEYSSMVPPEQLVS